MRAKFTTYEHQKDSVGITSSHLDETKSRQLLLPFATVESPVSNRKTTLKGKLPLCKNDFPKQKLSEILVAESISSEKDLEPYWNGLCKVVNSRLLLPIGIDSPDSVSTLDDTSLNKTVANSWFLTKQNTVRKKNGQRLFSQSCLSSVAECTDSEVAVIKSKKIRVYPDKEQRGTLRKWFGTARFVYNKTIALLNETDTKANWKAIKTGIIHSLPDWAKEVPYQIKSVAIRDTCIAVREAKIKCQKTGEFQSVSFKSKRRPSDSIFIPKSAIKSRGVYYTLLGNLKMSEQLPDNIRDARLVKENDKYYLSISYTATTQKRKPNGRVVALYQINGICSARSPCLAMLTAIRKLRIKLIWY